MSASFPKGRVVYDYVSADNARRKPKEQAMTNPMDSVSMPEPFGYAREWQGDASDENNWLFETNKLELDAEAWASLYTKEQLLSAYEMGRNAGHNEGWKACLEEWAKHMKGMAEAIGGKK